MNSFYEFIGPPGSGKTFLYKKIRAKIKNKKKIFRGDEYFFKYYYDKEKKNFKYRLYYHYKRNQYYWTDYLHLSTIYLIILSLSKNADEKSIYEKNLEDKSNKMEEFKKSKIAEDIQKVFSDAKLIDLKEEE